MCVLNFLVCSIQTLLCILGHNQYFPVMVHTNTPDDYVHVPRIYTHLGIRREKTSLSKSQLTFSYVLSLIKSYYLSFIFGLSFIFFVF